MDLKLSNSGSGILVSCSVILGRILDSWFLLAHGGSKCQVLSASFWQVLIFWCFLGEILAFVTGEGLLVRAARDFSAFFAFLCSKT